MALFSKSQIGSASVMKISVNCSQVCNQLATTKAEKSGRTDLFNRTWGFLRIRPDLVVAMEPMTDDLDTVPF
jgi:hypothetical protein